MKLFITNTTLLYSSVTTGHTTPIVLSIIASLWVLLNQYYNTKKLVEKEHKGSWRQWFKFVNPFKKKN